MGDEFGVCRISFETQELMAICVNKHDIYSSSYL